MQPYMKMNVILSSAKIINMPFRLTAAQNPFNSQAIVIFLS